MRGFTWLFCVAALSAGGAHAQVEADPVEEVTVRARTEREQRRAVSAFVKELSAPGRRGRLARWSDGDAFCPGVVGLPAKYAEYITDRIAAEATGLGLRVGEPGCRPSVLILFAKRPDLTAQRFAKDYDGWFAARDRQGQRDGGVGRRPELEQFLITEAPVRWWSVSRMTTADDRPMGGEDTVGDIPTNIESIPVTFGVGASRLRVQKKQELARALVIVDGRELERITWGALADYLAMVSLAQVDPAAEPEGLSSVLTLFRDRDSGRPVPAGMTEWDRAYLRGLYDAPEGAADVRAQEGAIRNSLNAQRKVDATPEP